MSTNDWKLRTTARILKHGGVIAYPTETVWGLGCDPFDARAVHRILRLKQRDVAKGLILLSARAEDFEAVLAPLTKEQRVKILTSQFDGPATTWLVPDPYNHFPYWVKGNHSSVAIRLTNQPLIADLNKHWKGPLVSTSANPSTRPTAHSRIQLRQYFSNYLDYILPGECAKSASASRIIDITTGKVLR